MQYPGITHTCLNLSPDFLHSSLNQHYCPTFWYEQITRKILYFSALTKVTLDTINLSSLIAHTNTRDTRYQFALNVDLSEKQTSTPFLSEINQSPRAMIAVSLTTIVITNYKCKFIQLIMYSQFALNVDLSEEHTSTSRRTSQILTGESINHTVACKIDFRGGIDSVYITKDGRNIISAVFMTNAWQVFFQ